MLKEFKPSILFLVRFLVIYFVGNVLYGLYVESFDNTADSITTIVTTQSSGLLNLLGSNTSAVKNSQGPTVFIETSEKIALSVFEGCNGVNVMIIFVAFVVAFGGPWKKMLWFIPAGLAVIHASNLLRIALLFFVSEHYSEYFYYVHKYFFTAILYLVVFILWVIWVVRFNVRQKKASAAEETAGS